MRHISVIGAGMFGFPIANYLAERGFDVLLFDINKELINYMIENRKHKFHFTNLKINNKLKLSSIFEDIEDSELIILSIPSQKIRDVLKKINNLNINKIKILNLSKGLEVSSGKLISEIVCEELTKKKSPKFATLSGGMIAEEFVNKKPLFVTIASKDSSFIKELLLLFSSDFLCFTSSNDIKGVELAGPLKNIIGIFSGIAFKLGYKESTIAGFITAFSFEIKELAHKLGCSPETFSTSSPAWAGDVMATCFGKSRNKEFGERIVNNSPISVFEEMKKENKLVEGYETTKVLYNIIKKLKLNLPIISKIYGILFENKNPELVFKSSICNLNKF